MSATIDQRVVEMRFDNKQFESNVSTTMSTLDKLKAKLNLPGASKSLNDINTAAKGFGNTGFAGAVDAVTAKFSALQVMGVTALANITNSAINAGKNIVKSLTIDPIMAGFSEYETKMGSIQTILANTEHQGTTMDDVTSALDELNLYADKTIYNFQEMTRNIGTFTAAGVDLDTSVRSIQGIANLAAVSGSTSQQASTAMYQLSQALSTGTVRLQDWNSVVNAGMGGKVFQNALIQTAAMLNGSAEDVEAWQKKNIDAFGSFRDSLTQGEWLTSEVLTKTLQQFTMAAEEGSETWKEYKKELMDDGYTEKQAESILKMANTATDAATKVKTFTQLMDTLKESAQSGWAQTWELLVGDFEEAKAFFTELSDLFGGIIGESAERRNNLLSGALSSNWDKMIGKINEAGIETEKFEDSVRKVVGETKFDALVEEYGSLEEAARKGKISSDDLKAAIDGISNTKLDGFVDGLKEIERTLRQGDRGEDVKKLQTALNTLGYDLGKSGIDGVLGSATAKAIKEFQKANDLKITGIVDEETLAALEKAGTKTAEMKGNVDDLKSSCSELIDVLTEKSGRELLLDSLMNVIKAIQKPLSSVGQALREVFDIKPTQLYDAIQGLNEFTKSLVMSDESADKVRRAFKGFFSIFDMGRKVLVAFGDAILDALGSEGVGNFATFLLDTAASIGDFFTSLNDNFDINGVSDIFTSLASGLSSALDLSVDVFKGFGSALSAIGKVIVNAAKYIWEGLKTVGTWISENFSAADIFAGLAGGGIFVLAKKLIGFVDGIKESLEGLFKKGEDGGGIKEKFTNLLDGVHDSLESFTTGLKSGSILAIAIAIGILSASINTLAKLDMGDISSGLFAIGALLTMLSVGLRSMTKTLTTFDSKGIVKSSFALILVAAAIKILADAMEAMSGLSWEEIAKGLVGVGGGLTALITGLKFLDGVKVSLGTSIAMLALAEACKILGDAMEKFSGFSWSEIARGLVGMGGALGELVIALSVLSKVGGLGSLFGSLGILIAVQSLGDLADALGDFSGYSWEEIGRGLAGMGGALGEVALITGALGKLAGFSSIFASGALLIVIQGLGELASAFESFGNMSWDEIGRGLAGLGGALGEVALITGALGVLAGFSSIFASGALLIVIQGLGELASAFSDFGGMSWEEIGRGLVGMGGALGEVALITGTLGVVAGFSSIFASGALLIVIKGLGDLASAFTVFGEMTWEEISRGLVGMGGALAEIALITGALGALAGLPAILGGGAILLAVQGLGDIADALKKFGEMSWDEIGRGLSAMCLALGDIAVGGLLNTLSGFGAAAIAEMAAPLGVLADSVKKWSGVTVPEGLDTQLSSLALGVMEFTFGGLGASALAEAAPAVGTMADSVKKWNDVSVPEDLGTNLTTLATGVKAFTFGGLGASALSDAAPGVGAMADSVAKWSGVVIPENLGVNLESLGAGVLAFTFGGSGASSLAEAAPGVGSMADSVKKWAGVVVPEGLGTNLESLATGVKAFTFGGLGAGALTEVAPSLGTLADSVMKWVGVTIPEGLVEKLDTLASGISKFSFGGLGAETISSCAAGLGTMADSVKKWTGVTVPEELGTNLSTLATGVKSFTFGGSGADTLTTAAAGVGAMATAVNKWSDVTIPEGFVDNLNGLATAIKNLPNSEDVSSTVTELESLATTLSKLAGIGYATINDGLTNLSGAISGLSSASKSASGVGESIRDELTKPLKNISKDLSSVGNDIISTINSSVNSNKATLTSTMKSVVNNVSNAIKDKLGEFKSNGEKLATKFADGINSKKDNASKAGETLGSNAASGASKASNDMTSAGYDLGNGLVAGINAKVSDAYNAGYALGQAAVQGEKDGQASNSPSKATIQAGKWLGEGLVIGIERMGNAVYNAGSLMGKDAIGSVSKSIQKVSDLIQGDVDAQPSIRPVIDLSNVKTGIGALNAMLDSGSSMDILTNVGAVSTLMNRRGQNGANFDIVSAIDKLRKDVGKIKANSISIGDISYDDGSAVGNAVFELVRAMRVEGRI